MKTKLTIALLSMAILSSCGKTDIGNAQDAAVSYVTANGETIVGTANNNFTTIEQVRSAFNAKSLEAGVSEGMYIYHIGSKYGANSGSGISGGISISGCFFGLFGDCDDNNTSNQNYQLQSYLDNGRMQKVGAVNLGSSSLNIKKATGVLNNDFTYTDQVYTRTSAEYTQMLGLNSSATETRVFPATVEISDVTGNKIVDAVIVEHINKTYQSITSIKRYVISTNVPVAANPIAVIEGNSNIQVTGVLKSIGTTGHVKKINVDRYTGVSFWGNETVGYNLEIRLQ